MLFSCGHGWLLFLLHWVGMCFLAFVFIRWNYIQGSKLFAAFFLELSKQHSWQQVPSGVTDPLTDLPTQTLGKAGVGNIQKMRIQYSICSFPFKMSWDIGTSNKTLERYRHWDALIFSLSLTLPKSGQLGPSLPQIQCDNRLGLDSAPPWRISETSFQSIRFLLVVLLSSPPVCSAGSVELWCPTFYPRSQGLNHVCLCSLNKESSGFRY